MGSRQRTSYGMYMKNPNITTRERNLLKGAIRRVFSRSDLRRRIIDLTIVKHYDPTRLRVKTWCKCQKCGALTPKSYMVVDHISPVIGINETLEDLTWDTVIDRVWCNENNLMAIDPDCHAVKTKAENKERRKAKKEKRK